MIDERDSLSKDTLRQDFNDVYWEQRYTLKPSSVPIFLVSHQEKILQSGKYLNVLRECNKFAAIDQSLHDFMPLDSLQLIPDNSKASANNAK